ncbi:MAG: hypothetical protein JW771_08150, partial [Candidatus Thermoplasmatota archaeon]|nr:hypothetical protein [Candidatus Thermoplasmatota archaeon]
MSKNNENTSSDKEFLNLIKPNEERRRIKNIGIIFWILIISIVSICSGFIFNLFFIFNIETFYWVTSAIIQAFGTMLAIVISIAIYRMQTTENQTSDITEKLMKLDYKEENKGKIMTMVIDLLKGSLQTLEDLRTRMSNIIISMGFLVVMALLMIFFTKINLKSNLIIDNN